MILNKKKTLQVVMYGMFASKTKIEKKKTKKKNRLSRAVERWKTKQKKNAESYKKKKHKPTHIQNKVARKRGKSKVIELLAFNDIFQMKD